MSFDSLGLSADLLRAVREQGYEQPTPIQERAIPVVLSGQDVMASAQTGTGKTAAFTLPLLQQLSAQKSERRLRALILTPTRELAAQVHENLRAYGRHLPIRSLEVFGGVNINPQIERLRRGVDVLIATPGRLIDHIDRGTVRLDSIQTLVLDEADRMLDMGFRPAIDRIVRALPRKRQTLLFSATFSSEIKQLAQRYQHDPVPVETAPPNSTVELIAQQAINVDQGRKRELLSWMIGDQNWQQVLVFTRTKHGANRLAKQLTADGLPAAAIHGNKSQGARTRALAEFKSREIRVLVATDIAARGLDIDQLPHVVNFEIPNVPEDYVHRIGRTGRAGRDGLAISLIGADEQGLFQDIRKLVGVEIPTRVIEGYEPTDRPSPDKKPSGGRRGGGGRNRGAPASRASAGNSEPGRRRRRRGGNANRKAA
ncbi:DEAD/DEAH box helicase [Wenzhouxiangella marina]|uniref:DEAD-box ATP-dependent RNA helicase RhpA n=1 Tax=Wenzhouxiangella marina TaxID=1579979 RepID=A0A0K0XWP4_9GAMM|nr:DEAD/DEAH box helicase [Wenzhouxiangella marina]AKS42052.1 ATP-dependent RNA helicase RhlE [Wenzhouxiangella marina]MBB6086179.1 ATP-dependent RNA helicase RhlE [Wenzhouxiangella marina]